MIDVTLLLILALVAWNVAAEGAWGAAAAFLSVLFSGLVAMDYFEPLADLLQMGLGIDWASRVDFIALVGLFAAGVFGLRYLSAMARSQFHRRSGPLLRRVPLGVRRFDGLCHHRIFADGPAHGSLAARVSGLHSGAQQLLRVVGTRSRLAGLRAIYLGEIDAVVRGGPHLRRLPLPSALSRKRRLAHLHLPLCLAPRTSAPSPSRPLRFRPRRAAVPTRRTPRDPPASDVHWRTVWASGRGRGACVFPFAEQERPLMSEADEPYCALIGTVEAAGFCAIAENNRVLIESRASSAC